MTTRIHLKCDGCDAETHTAPIRKEFISFSGRGHGFGKWHNPDLDAAVQPTGWVWSDPATSCTYCPDCWKQIENGEAA